MFDLAWSEIALIAVVAIVVIGPKDLPDAVRGVARMVRKARQMVAEFHTQADELVREANLHEVRESLNEIRNFNIKGTIERAVDADGSIRKTFSEDPLRDWPHTPATDSVSSSAGEAGGTAAAADSVAGAAPDSSTAAPTPPAFVPPSAEPEPQAKPQPAPSGPPAFIPPSAAGKAAGSSTQDV